MPNLSMTLTDDEDAFTSGMSGSGDLDDFNNKLTLGNGSSTVVEPGSGDQTSILLYIIAASVAFVLVAFIVVLITIYSRKRARKEKSFDQSGQVITKANNKQVHINVAGEHRLGDVLEPVTLTSQVEANNSQQEGKPSQSRNTSKTASNTHRRSRDKIHTESASLSHCDIPLTGKDKIRDKKTKHNNITQKTKTEVVEYDNESGNIYSYCNDSERLGRKHSPAVKERKSLVEVDVARESEDVCYVEVVESADDPQLYHVTELFSQSSNHEGQF